MLEGSVYNFSLVGQVLTCIGVGSNSIFGGPNVIYTAITAICAACMNINKLSRVKYWGGGGGAWPPLPPLHS